MARLEEKRYKRRLVAFILVFILGISLVGVIINKLANNARVWTNYVTTVEKMQVTVDVVRSSVSSIKNDRVLLNDFSRIVRNYDTYLSALKGDVLLKQGNKKFPLPTIFNKKSDDLLVAIEDSWLSAKTSSKDLVDGKDLYMPNFVDNLNDLRNFQSALIEESIVQEGANKVKLLVIISILGTITLLSLIMICWMFYRGMYHPLVELDKELEGVSEGNNEEVDLGRARGISRHLIASLNKIIFYNREAAVVLEKIGNGDFNQSFARKSDNDVLGIAIENMKDKVQQLIEEDRKKSTINNWMNQGLAKFAEILQNNSENINELTDTFLTELISYLEANQGTLYLMNEQEGVALEDQSIELKFTYAWNRKKHLKKTLKVGEDLAGQAILENDTIYLTDIPSDYIDITSGIGKALPTSLLIVPIKLNEQPKGVIEIASFKLFEPYQIEMIEKICENLASTVVNTVANEKTKILLTEAQQLTIQMKEQEDLMRRSQEEMMMEQEEAKREINRLEAQIEEVNRQKKRLEQDLEQVQNG